MKTSQNNKDIVEKDVDTIFDTYKKMGQQSISLIHITSELFDLCKNNVNNMSLQDQSKFQEIIEEYKNIIEK